MYYSINMNRFKTFVLLGIVNNVLFFTASLLGFQDVAGIIGFLLFLFSIIYLLFSIEEPPEPNKLKIPEVHKLYKSKQNNLNNFLAFEFVIISSLFGILVLYLNLPVAIVVALLWSITIPVVLLTIKLLSKNLLITNAINYCKLLYPELLESEIEFVVKDFISIGSLDKSELVAGSKDKNTSKILVDAYIDYVNAQTITQDEVEAINDL